MVSGQPQQSSREQEDPESKTSKSKSAAVVLGPEKPYLFVKDSSTLCYILDTLELKTLFLPGFGSSFKSWLGPGWGSVGSAEVSLVPESVVVDDSGRDDIIDQFKVERKMDKEIPKFIYCT